MEVEIPQVVELIYHGMVTGPDPRLWPEHLRNNPVRAHGLWSFYSGLCMGLQLGACCMRES